jgi:hypothetical protein
MKTRIALGAGLLLTLGTAMAGTLIYGQGQERSAIAQPELTAATVAVDSEVTPQMLATWRAEAAVEDYVSPKVPL